MSGPASAPVRSALRCFAIRTVPLLCLAAACTQNTALSYLVTIAPDNPHQLEVTLELKHPTRDSLTLKAYAAKDILRLADFEAAGPRGEPLSVEARVDTVLVEGRPVDIPHFVIRGPMPSSVTVHYRVSPGRREGDSHVGYTGLCYGYVGEEFALVTGREVFLLPQPAEAIADIRVSFSLPVGWVAVTPWKKGRPEWHPGVRGAPVAEHLISAAVGLGRFRERSFVAGGTRFRCAFESRVSKYEEEQAATRIERVARYFHGLFGRGLGSEYLAVVVPQAPTGDEIAGEGWATGQGQTFAPMTAGRLHEFAQRLIEAYVRHAPYRTEIRHTEEYWLVDGIAHWYAWRAVARAGIISEEDVDRELASAYLATLGAKGSEMNLERAYGTHENPRFARGIMAPFLLFLMDHELRTRAGAKDGFDAVIRHMFGKRVAPSLWASLPSFRAGFWDDFRARYVRGTAVAPVEEIFALAPTRPKPEPAGGTVARTLTLVYTGNSYGYLENCGCKVNQSGGVARRATVLRRIRRTDPDALVLDAGNSFLLPEKQRELDFFSKEEQALYLRMVDLMKYSAATVGMTELAFGLDHFRELTRGLATPYVAANIREGGVPVAPSTVLLRADAVRVAVIGIFEPPRGEGTDAVFEEHTASLTIEDPVETLRREVPGARERSDLVIAIGRMTPATIRRVVASCPGIDILISTQDDSPTLIRGAGGPQVSRHDNSGFLGKALVLYTTLRNYGFNSVKVGLDAEGRIASALIADHMLFKDVPDDSEVRDRLNRFYDRVGRIEAAQASVEPLFQDDPARQRGRYVGAARCERCHQEEYAQWKTTKHAAAYKTLLDVHRHYQPKCISCHVVGYGARSGYRVGSSEEPLGNVQCEVCHGPGGEHVAAPSATNTRRAVPEKVCLECHNPDHSDHFVYAEQILKVRHD